VQTCEAGEIAWISEEGGATEADHPAPRIVLTEIDPARTTTTNPSTTTTTTPSPTTTERNDAGPGAAGEDDGEDDDEGLGAWPYVVGAMALLVGGAGVAVLRDRRARANRSA
jgi:hypothetical protein